jgi:iron-sulfur cluster assembly accessory protein
MQLIINPASHVRREAGGGRDGGHSNQFSDCAEIADANAKRRALMALAITLTENAAKKIQDFMKQTGKEGYGLRMRVIGGGCSGLQYQLGIDEKPAPGDKVLDSHGVQVFVDLKSALYLAGVEVDYVEGLMESGFKITNPNAKSTCGCGQSFH